MNPNTIQIIMIVVLFAVMYFLLIRPQKKQEKEFYVERVNERKEFVWQLLKQLGYTFDDICIIGGSLALLKEKIDSELNNRKKISKLTEEQGK